MPTVFSYNKIEARKLSLGTFHPHYVITAAKTNSEDNSKTVFWSASADIK